MDTLLKINKTTICVLHRPAIRCRGVFHGDNPFRFSTPLLLIQLAICAFLSALFQHCLTPLGQTTFISQILVGVVVGPSLIGKFFIVKELIFPPQSFYISDTFAFFGVMLFLFLVGVKTDISIMRRPGKRAISIGVCTFLLPLILNLISARTLNASIRMNSKVHKHLYWITMLQSLSNFHVIACFLADLKLLNTEVGRLAISSSMISGCCSWFFLTFLYAARQSQFSTGKSHLSFYLVLLFVIVVLTLVICILRPIMIWMVRHTTHEESVKESFVFWVFLMILGVALFGEMFGQHFVFGPMLLGVAVPNGPPFGSALVTKLETFVSLILLPLYFLISGARMDLQLLQAGTLGIVHLLSFLGFVWKIVGVMLPSLYWQIPLGESLHLSLIMSSQGIIDVLIFSRAATLKLIDREIYTSMVLSAIVLTAILSPIVKFLYKPTKRYVAYRRTIQHAKPYGELRILACVHQEGHTPAMINLLDATYPNPQTPICVYVLHLIDLQGRAVPVLEAHQPGKKSTSPTHESFRIINAFNRYEQQKEGHVIVYPYTAISPYETMHEDVCGLAIDKRVCLVILPFFSHDTSHGPKNLDNAIRSVNRSILKLAPCSVGILIDRGSMKSNIHLTSTTYPFYVGVIFVGGQDDREALSYGRRMAKNPTVGLTVVHIIESCSMTNISADPDARMISEFKHEASLKTKKCVYIEQVVTDSVDVISVIRNVQNSFDLIMVGRRHSNSTTLLQGLTEWNDFPELGFMGDMLASPDAKCHVSVLVMQQQAVGGEETLDSPKYLHEDDASFVNISPTAKVTPLF